jgi:hypothetical protein
MKNPTSSDENNCRPLTVERLKSYPGLSGLTLEEGQSILNTLKTFALIVLELHGTSAEKNIILKTINPESDAGQ